MAIEVGDLVRYSNEYVKNQRINWKTFKHYRIKNRIMRVVEVINVNLHRYQKGQYAWGTKHNIVVKLDVPTRFTHTASPFPSTYRERDEITSTHNLVLHRKGKKPRKEKKQKVQKTAEPGRILDLG